MFMQLSYVFLLLILIVPLVTTLISTIFSVLGLHLFDINSFVFPFLGFIYPLNKIFYYLGIKITIPVFINFLVLILLGGLFLRRIYMILKCKEFYPPSFKGQLSIVGAVAVFISLPYLLASYSLILLPIIVLHMVTPAKILVPCTFLISELLSFKSRNNV